MKESYSYHFDEAVVPVPGGFQDKSVQVLEWPCATPGDSMVMVVARRVPNMSFADDVRRDIDETRTGLKACVIEADAEGSVAEIPAHFLTMRYVREGKALYQRQVFLDSAPRLLTLLVVGPASTRVEVDELFAAAVDGIRFRE